MGLPRTIRSQSIEYKKRVPLNTQLQLFNTASTQHNLFFALRPPASAWKRIADLAKGTITHHRLDGRLLSFENLHVSLIPVGSSVEPVPSNLIEEAKALAETVAIAPFPVLFDHVASFGGRALALVGGDGVAGVVRLQQALNFAFAKTDRGLRQRKSSTPHLTMAYTDRTPTFSIKPIFWTAAEFVLIDSLVGQSKHIVLGRWPLNSPASLPHSAGGMR